MDEPTQSDGADTVVARLRLPMPIRGLDVLAAALEETYGGPLYLLQDGADWLTVTRHP